MAKIKYKTFKKYGFVKASEAALYSHPRSEAYKKAFQKYEAVKAWDRAVIQFFEDGEKLSKAVDFKEGVLCIACLSKEMAQKIKLFSQRIIYLINQIIGTEIVFALSLQT